MTGPGRIVARLAAGLGTAAMAAVLTLALPGAAHADQSVLVVHTVPATPGARVSAEGTIAVADKHGVARLPVRNWDLINGRFHVLDTRVSDSRKVKVDRILGSPSSSRGGKPLEVGLRSERLVSWSFVDRGGQEIPTSRVSLLQLRSNTGQILDLKGSDLTRPRWMDSGRTQQTPVGLVNKELYWSVTRVVVDGADVVNSSQQVFFPEQNQAWQISLLFYRVSIDGTDLLFGGASGKGVELKMPDGELVQKDFDADGTALFPSLPRGAYEVRILGAGASYSRPLSISRDQDVSIEVISPLDVGVVLAAGVLVALSLLVIGRRHRITSLAGRLPRRAGTAMLLLLLVAGLTKPSAPASAAEDPGAPAYAYFYIWYQPTSWLRAKSDYPLLGRYSSDDRLVMRRQVEMASTAGLDGFIVSWKHTDTLDRRLEQLVTIARDTQFELSVVYQGLDYERQPLPVGRVIRDLTWFAARYGHDPVFGRFGKPVVAITGTEDFTIAGLRRITQAVGDDLKILGTAKDAKAYARIAPLVEGNAYYWSSAHPGPGWYTEKLVKMGAAVHADGGLWFAPAAPGFDARLIGGEQVIPRNNGDTLRDAVAAAQESDPDVLAIISWNEFSENSDVEPSEKYGTDTLSTLASILGGKVWLPEGAGVDATQRGNTGITGWGALAFIVLLLAALNLGVAILRPGRRRDPPKTSTDRGPGPDSDNGRHTSRMVQ